MIRFHFITDRGRRSDKLRGDLHKAFERQKKFTHKKVKYHVAPVGHEDHCAACMSYRERNECVKVQAPISPDGWCMVGTRRKDGQRFDKRGEKLENGS